jgi:hypothetical protein
MKTQKEKINQRSNETLLIIGFIILLIIVLYQAYQVTILQQEINNLGWIFK